VLLARREARVSAPEHGTYARYQQEKLARLEPCEPCRAANRDYTAAYRQRTGRNKGPGQPPRGCAKGLGWPHADPVLARILGRPA
jgi:hypothetical protein